LDGVGDGFADLVGAGVADAPPPVDDPPPPPADACPVVEPDVSAAQPWVVVCCVRCAPGPIATVDARPQLIVESVITVPVTPGRTAIAYQLVDVTVVCLI
jgi:hypothetical protein